MPALILKRAIPSIPNSVSAEGISPSTILVSWGDTNSGDATTEVWVSLDGVRGWVLLATVIETDSSFPHAIGTQGATRYYKIRARVGSQKSKFSPVVSAATLAQTLAPTGLQLTVDGSNQITASWTDTNGGLASYLVEKSLNGSDWTTVATTATGATSQIVNALTADTLYHIGVTAVIGGVFSTRVTAQATTDEEGGTVPDDPTSLTITPATSTRANWAFTDNANNETGYKIERAPDVAGSPGTYVEIDVIGGNQTSYSSNDQVAEGVYWGRVRAYNSFGNSGYSNAVQYAMPAAPETDITILPEGVTSAVARATAGTAEWQAFEAYLDANLNVPTEGGYQGSQLETGVDFVFGGICLKAINPTKSDNYFQRGIGLLKSGMREMQSSVGGNTIGFQYLGRGDGLNTDFTLPGVPIGSISIRRCNVTTHDILRQTVHTFDVPKVSSGDRHIIKISDTPDGTEDYAPGTDWTRRLYGFDWLIDWRNAGSAPAPGATYYETRASVGSGTTLAASAYSIVGGTTLRMVTPPTTGQAIFVRMLYHETTGDMLKYQMTLNWEGIEGQGFGAPYNDASFPCRYLKYVPIMVDWLAAEYAGMPPALVDEAVTLCQKWCDAVNAGGSPNLTYSASSGTYTLGTTTYRHPTTATTNYGSATDSFFIYSAMFIENRVVGGSTYRTTAITRRTNYKLPGIAPLSDTFATLYGGQHGEGWNYGLCVRRIILIGQAMLEAGWIANCDLEYAFASQVLKFWVHAAPTQGFIYSIGDNNGNPMPAPNRWNWGYLSGLADDAQIASYGRHYFQNGPGTAEPNFRVLMYYDPAGAAADPTATEGLGYLAEGHGVGVFRSSWSSPSTATWVGVDGCGRAKWIGGESQMPGCVLIYRGEDILTPDAHGISGGPYSVVTKRYSASVVMVDDNRENLITTRWTTGSSYATEGVRVKAFETVAAYAWHFCDSKAMWRKGGAATSTANIVRQDRSTFLVRAAGYVVTYDRVETTSDTHPKRWQWYLNTTAAHITGGTFTLTYNGNTSAPIAYNATSATVKAVLEGLGTGTVAVTFAAEQGGTTATTGIGNFRVIWSSPSEHKLPITGNGASLTTAGGGTGRVVVRDWTAESATFSYTTQIIHLAENIAGAAWNTTVGGSKLFSRLYSDVAIECWHERPVGFSGLKILRRVMAQNTSDTAGLRFVGVHQSTSSATGSMDACEHINATKFQGVLIGNTVVLFGKAHTGTGATGYVQSTAGGTSYSFTGTGSTVTHYVTDLTPNQGYTLSGDASGTPTASAKGVLTFTTSGSGAKTVTIT